MSFQKEIFRNCWCGFAGFAVTSLLLLSTPAFTKTTLCAADNLATLQQCINSAAAIDNAARTDTVIVNVATGLYSGKQIRINRRKNLWVIGDTTATEANQPRILFQDRQHVYTDLQPALRADTSVLGTYGQNNGTVWIYQSDNIRLMGLLVDGNSVSATTNTSGRIFAYGATLGKVNPVEIRGNVGVNVLLSRNVQLRYLSITNTWNGVSVIAPNLGGAFAFPDPNDPLDEVTATLPTSQAGLYGNHLIERCRIHDNIFGMLFQRDWDLSSVVRNNLFWNNYLRHWNDPKTPKDYVANLEVLDKAKRADGSYRSLAYTTVGGAFLMTDVALTPYRIHNNTFQNNATIFSGYYKTGTQHLFYNNLVGRPYQFFRRAVDLNVQANDAGGYSFTSAYTQTERNSEMLQYFSEHQRSNRVVDQDSIPTVTNVAPNYWSGTGGNLRLYNMRQIRTNNGNWLGGGPTGAEPGRSWTNDQNVQDSVTMTWVPDTAAKGTIAQQSDTGGIVRWVRHNMWAGSYKDFNMDPNPGQNWCPPWVPRQIKSLLDNPAVFRNTGSFDIRWTLGLPVDTVSANTSAAWLKPLTTNMGLKGWMGYEGSPTQPLAIGAYDPAGGWAAPARRLVLRDTLIESVGDSIVKFRLNVSGQGITNSDISMLEVYSAKFYNDVPVSDTLYNQGPNAAGTGTTVRVNSILSQKPWPLPYQFLPADYNRLGYRVDDSLTKNKLSPENEFIGRIGAGSRLPPDSLYARAEVVLKATLADGSVIFSNPGVFMFSRPRFQFDVTVLDAVTGQPLPPDPDGISIIAQAHQPLKIVIKAKTVATLPVPFKGYGNLQMGSAGGLHGADGQQLQQYRRGVWSTRHPNDTITPYFSQNDFVLDTLRAMVSPSTGTLKYSAVFMDTSGRLLPYFIEGRSAPIKVVSGSIYQVTIDSIYRYDTVSILSPSVALKQVLNQSSHGRRDTLLVNGVDLSSNVAKVNKGEDLLVVLQVRDKYGNQVLDSNSITNGLRIKLSHALAPGRYPNVTADLNMLSIYSGTGTYPSIQIDFDSKGRATARIHISAVASKSTLAALRASIIDALGREIGTPGAARDSGIADTAWVKTDKASFMVQWVDTNGLRLAPIANGWVGEWYPVRLKMTKDLKGTLFTGIIGASSLQPVYFHPAKGDTSHLANLVFANDSMSAVVWIRANDSITGAWINAGADSLADSLGNLNFRYPQISNASFYDRDCDGRIDSLVAWMNGPLSFRPVSGVVLGDSLDAKFPHQFLSPSAMGIPARAGVLLDSILTFSWAPGTLGAADAQANRIVVGNPLTPGRVIQLAIANLKDKAPPVTLSAFDQQSWANGLTDSLVVKFSEAIDLTAFGKGAVLPFAVIRSGVATPMSAVKLAKPAMVVDTNGSASYAFVFTGATGVLQKGDSLVVNGDAISDLAGNKTGATCTKPVGINFNPKYQPTQGYVIDIDGDGNADSVHLGFKDSLGTLPNQIFIQWGTEAETLTVTYDQLLAMGVKTSDSSFTVPTRNWHGKDMVIDGDLVANVPRTVGPKDSARFEGGLSWEWLADRVPPVLIHARLKWARDWQMTGVVMDTLTVDFSENVTGCDVGADPSLCLKAQGVRSPVFSVGSSILATTGSRWTILVPRTGNSIVPGDSVGELAANLGGDLVDVTPQKNGPGINTRFVQVLGDPPPPSRGLMLDRDGDGRVDAVLLQYFVKPYLTKLPSFQFEWGDSVGVPVILTSDSAYQVDSTHWMAVLKTPGKYAATGYGPSGIKYTNGTQLGQTTYSFPVRDSAGPVLKPYARLNSSSLKSGSDTVFVWPSEPLKDPTGSVLLEFRRDGVVVRSDSVKFQSAVLQANGSWMVVIGPDSPYRPSPGDQTRLSTSGSVVDTVLSANKPHKDHAWVPLVGSLRVPYASSYLDASKDGRIDEATFDFASPVAEGTRIRVYDPAGSDLFREYVVTASDAGKTHIEFSFASNPWGQDVTSLIKPDLGLLLPSVALDTNVFKGGKFNIQDRVEPVVSSCRLRYTSDTSSVDTLVCKVSEMVSIDLTQLPLRYRSSTDLSDTGIAIQPDGRFKIVFDSIKGTITIMLKPFPVGYSNPATGDSLRLSWNGVTDKSGNAPGEVTKWVQVVANQRVFPPTIQVTNSLITNDHKAGDLLPGDQFVIVGRDATYDGSTPWSSLDPSGSKWTPGSSTYTHGTNGSGGGEVVGTVIFIQTNVPTTIKLYIYDNVGTYVGQIFKYISQEMLDQLAKAAKSRTGMVDVGILWKGQRDDGRLVSSGVYPVRLLAMREPVAEEKEQGKVNTFIYNRLINIGVRLRLDPNW